MMIEQPLAHDDIIDHAELQRQLKTPICLDECIRTARHAEQAIELRACRIINIKLGRVGGFREATRCTTSRQAAGIPVWCGGMLEAGIGRAHNIALSTLPNFTLPGDVSAKALLEAGHHRTCGGSLIAGLHRCSANSRTRLCLED